MINFRRYLINVASLWSGITSTKDWHEPCFSWGGGEHLGPMFFCWYAEYHHPPFMELSVTHSKVLHGEFLTNIFLNIFPMRAKSYLKGPHHVIHVQRLKDNVLLTGASSCNTRPKVEGQFFTDSHHFADEMKVHYFGAHVLLHVPTLSHQLLFSPCVLAFQEISLKYIFYF